MVDTNCYPSQCPVCAFSCLRHVTLRTVNVVGLASLITLASEIGYSLNCLVYAVRPSPTAYVVATAKRTCRVAVGGPATGRCCCLLLLLTSLCNANQLNADRFDLAPVVTSGPTSESDSLRHICPL